MSGKNNGGPAFPEIRIVEGGNYNPAKKLYSTGMTLRDWFAAKAMQAYINAYPGGSPDHRDAPVWVPQAAYEMADEMLRARERA